MKRWRCDKCGNELTTKSFVSAVYHACPKASGWQRQLDEVTDDDG